MLSVDLVNLVKEISQYIEKKRAHDPELVAMFMKLNQDIMGLIAENADLTAQVKDLRAKEAIEDGLRFNKQYGTWEKDVNGELLQYCPKCKVKGDLVPMQEQKHEYVCRACGNKCNRPENPRSAVVHLSRR